MREKAVKNKWNLFLKKAFRARLTDDGHEDGGFRGKGYILKHWRRTLLDR